MSDPGPVGDRDERDLRAVHPAPGGPAPGEGPRGGDGGRNGQPVLHDRYRVDGVYDADPEKHPGATRYTQIGYTDVLSNRLGALDATAVSLAMDNEMPIVVFDMTQPGNIVRAILGESIGTLVAGEVTR